MHGEVLDPTILGELLDLGGEEDREFVVELVDLFLRDAPAKVEAIVEGAMAGDLERVERAAHSLKGSAGNLGAIALQRLAETLQNAGRTGDRSTVVSAAPRIESVFGEARTALRGFTASLCAQGTR